jgi:DNA adenine methylase
VNFQYSPLRYPGGKAKIAPYLKSVIEKNSLSSCQYLEPFAGGAGAALDLLLCEFVDSIYINDADRMIYSFWKSILTQTEKFINKIENTEVTIDEWKKQKNIINRKNVSTFSLGFAAFYLNRCNVSGILTGGPIGGKEQNGNYKIDARMNKESLISKIQKISYYSDRIIPSNLDWHDFLQGVFNSKQDNKRFIYLDPPYYNKGQDLYMNYFVHEDHVELERYLRNKSNWILTYDYTPEIMDIYKNYLKKEYVLNYSARNVRKAKEIMIFSHNFTKEKT